MKEIDKIAFIYLKNERILSVLSKGKDTYYIPGGICNGEPPPQVQIKMI